MANLNKPIREKGIIISKKYLEARTARTDYNGKDWPATPEKFLVEVISCDEEDFNKETGIVNGVRLEYPVDKETYEKAKFGDWANVKYILTEFNKELRYRPESLRLCD